MVWPLLQWSLPDAGLFPEGASVHFGRAQVVALPPCPGLRDLLGAHCLLKGGAPSFVGEPLLVFFMGVCSPFALLTSLTLAGTPPGLWARAACLYLLLVCCLGMQSVI